MKNQSWRFLFASIYRKYLSETNKYSLGGKPSISNDITIFIFMKKKQGQTMMLINHKANHQTFVLRMGRQMLPGKQQHEHIRRTIHL